MNSDEKHESALACPICRKALDNKPGPNDFLCVSCNVQFPVTNGVPWLFRAPHVMTSQWQSRWSQYQGQITSRLAQIEKMLAEKSIMAATRARLSNIQTALAHNLKEIEKILNPLLAFAQTATPITADKIPWTQHFDSYFNNIFRDWGSCAGTSPSLDEVSENKLHFDFVIEGLDKSGIAKRSILVLGSGAGRLASDIHSRLAPKTTYSLDLNPLLMLIQKMMMSGEECELFETPRPARDAAHVAVKHKLSGSHQQGVHILMGDALNAPFRDHSIDLLVTPWLIDILPEAFDVFARRMNRLLPISGEWRIFGPLSYATSVYHNDFTSYDENEICEVLEKSGFEILNVRQSMLPYLQSESSAQKREEQTWLFVGRKIRHEKEPPATGHLPDWIIHTERPIPDDNFFVEFRGITRLQTEAFSLIDGKNSLSDIARILALHYGTPEKNTLNSVTNLFTSLIETHFRHFQKVR